MQELLGGLVFIGIVTVILTIFFIYFIFKSLQFVVLATNLYKKMVNRQDAMLKLLLDIRDNTKKFETTGAYTVNDTSDDESFICEDCKKEVPANAKVCPFCGAKFE